MKTFLPRLAVTNVIRYPLRSTITAIGVGMGVAIVLAVSMLNDASREIITRTVEELGSGRTDVWIEASGEKTASIGSRREGLAEETVQQIFTHPSVSSAHPVLEIRTLGSSERYQSPVELYLYGVSLADDRAVRNHVLTSGHHPTSPQQALAGEALAEELGIGPGASLTIQSPHGPMAVEISGLLTADEGTGLLRNNRIVFADLVTVQRAFNYQEEVTGLNVILEPGNSPTEAAAQFQELLPGHVTASTDPLMVASKRDDSRQLRVALMINSLFAIFVGGFLIYNTLTSIAEENRREVALLRLAGMSSGQVARLFLLQALVYALVGTGVGVLGGILLGQGMLHLLQRIFAFQTFVRITPSLLSILVAAGTGIGVTLVVALLPALKTVQISPLAVFQERETGEETAPRFTSRHAVGLALIILTLLLGQLDVPGTAFAIVRVSAPVLLFAGLIVVLSYALPLALQATAALFKRIFGVPGMLAARSLRLRLNRAVITIGAIAVVLAIAVGTLGMVHSMKTTTSLWLDETRWADLLVFSISGTEMDESILAELADVSFVQDVNPIRYFFVPYDHPQLSDEGFLFQAVIPAQFQAFANLEIVEGNTAEAIEAITHQPAVLINAGLSQRLGLQQGDAITLMTAQGQTDFAIAGTVVDYSDFIHRMGKIVYGSYETLETHWGATGYTVLQIHLTPGYPQDEAKRLLWQALSGTYDVKILTHSEEKADVSASIDEVFVPNYGIVVVMFVIVVLGMFNTVFVNVLFQMREFAILRAVGLQVAQVRLMVICEALAMGLIGSILGILAGLWVAVQTNLGLKELMGILVQFHMPWIMLGLTLVLVPPIAIFATLYPQHIASSLSIARVMQKAERL